MKSKVICQVQPCNAVWGEAQVQREINNFLLALDSYPARAAKEPRITFRQHLCSISVAGGGRPGKRSGRHSRD